MGGYNQDLAFIPAYLSAFCSAQYALARNPAVHFWEAANLQRAPVDVFSPQILTQIPAFIKSIVEYCNKSRTTTTLDLWRIPDLAIISICLLLIASVSSIVRSIEFDRVYSLFLLSGLSWTIGLGWTFNLAADLVGFGLLPLSIVTSLALTRLVQSMGSGGRNQLEEGNTLPEKVWVSGHWCIVGARGMKGHNDIYEDWARKKQQERGAWYDYDWVLCGTSYCKHHVIANSKR